MFGSAALLVFAMAQVGPPVAIPKQPLHVTWNQSPTGPGGSLMGPTDGTEWKSEVEVRFVTRSIEYAMGQTIDALGRRHPFYLPITRTIETSKLHYLSLRDGPSLTLNTPSGTIQTGMGQSPGAPSIPGFVLTASSASPFMLEFTCTNPRTAGAWGGDGTPLVITITP